MVRALAVELEQSGARFARANSLHPTDVRALIALLDGERSGADATPTWLSQQLGGLNSATVTALLDRLSDRGLVERSADPTDRRRVLLTVTTQARNVGESYFGPMIAEAMSRMERFDTAQLAVVREFLSEMTRAVEADRSR
ncbi:MarR family transcriptional regulator [Gordonia sinesedis]